MLLAAANIRPVPGTTVVNLELQICLARAVVVLLGGHLEAYFSSLAEEIVESRKGTWDEISVGHRKYISLLIKEEIFELAEQLVDQNFSDVKEVTKLKKRVEKIAKSFQSPQSVNIKTLKGFYRHKGADAVERLLRGFHPKNDSFYGWLDNRRIDLSRVKTVLTQLLVDRTDIAHGELDTQPTILDARLYVMTATSVVRLADQFMREAYPGLGVPEDSAT